MKLYAEETGSELVQALEGLVVSMLARVEVPSALWRKERNGEVTIETIGRLVPEFEVDMRGTADQRPRFAVVPLGEAVVEQAARLCATDRLRAYDAVQLATLLTLTARGTAEQFACFDTALRESAARRGIALVPERI